MNSKSTDPLKNTVLIGLIVFAIFILVLFAALYTILQALGGS